VISYFPNNDWLPLLKNEFSKPYFIALQEQLNQQVFFPAKEDLFKAFALCSFATCKVVILGQDPYHGEGQANGLCFSVNDGIAFPPSLQNILKEIESDLQIPFPISGNLERWADQGVLLLNATLTVRESEAGSHQNQGWETFIDAVIQKISDAKENVVFLLWGGFAKKKGTKINRNKHYVLETGHPSPLSANRGLWFGNKHFSQTNAYLESLGKTPIKW
jgi:uracil-DNA glycosylase